MGRFFGVRPVLAKGRERGIDDARMARGDRIIADAQSVNHAGAEGLYHHIAAFRQAQGGLHAVLGLQVQLHALFVAVGVGKKHRGPAALRTDHPVRLAPVDGFQLDHLGAMVRHHLGEQWPRQKQGEVEDADTFEFHGRFLLFFYLGP